MDKLTICLWFDTEAEAAMAFYCAIFPNSKPGHVARYTEAGPGPAGSAITAAFEVNGQAFVGLNGGPMFKFTEAISFQIPTKDQAETDYYWDALIADGGQPSRCGWLKDRFGVSWQVVPRRLMELLSSSDGGQAMRATQAMLTMGKIDIAALEAAAAG